MMKLPARITISRIQSNQPEFNNKISITITDEQSGVRVVEATMSPEDLALALTGLGLADVEVDWHGLNLIGTKRETKTTFVVTETLPGRQGYPLLEDIPGLLAPYEVDGWIGSRSDLRNMHRRAIGDDGRVGYRVAFIRYVDGDGNPVTP